MRTLLSSACIIYLVTTLTSCNNMDRPRPMVMRCTTERANFIQAAADAFQRNGYSVSLRDELAGSLEARDTLERVGYPYAGLVREWTVQHTGDSVIIHVKSVNTRLDDSEISQTWDKRRGDEIVKDWIRPVMISLESACGLGSPLIPNPR